MVFSHSSSRSEGNFSPVATIEDVRSSLRPPAVGRNFLAASAPTRSHPLPATNTGKKSSRADKLTSRGRVFTSGNVVPPLKSMARNMNVPPLKSMARNMNVPPLKSIARRMNISQVNKDVSPSRKVSRAKSAQASLVRGYYQNVREQTHYIFAAEEDKNTRSMFSPARRSKPPDKPFSTRLSHLDSSDLQLPQDCLLVRETGSNLKTQVQSFNMFVSNREMPCPIYLHSCPDVVSRPRLNRYKTSSVLLETNKSKSSSPGLKLNSTRLARRLAGSSSGPKICGRYPRSMSSEAVRRSNRGRWLDSWDLAGGHQAVSSTAEEDLAVMRESVKRSPTHSTRRLASADERRNKDQHRLLAGRMKFSRSYPFHTLPQPFWLSCEAKDDDETIKDEAIRGLDHYENSMLKARGGADRYITRRVIDTEDSSCTPTNTLGAWSSVSLDCSQRTSLDCVWESVSHAVPQSTDASSAGTVCLSHEDILPHINYESCCRKEPIPTCCKEPMKVYTCKEPIQARCSNEKIQSCCSKETIKSYRCKEPIQSRCSKEPIKTGTRKEPIQTCYCKEPIQLCCSKEAIKSYVCKESIQSHSGEEPINTDRSKELIQSCSSKVPIQSCYSKEPFQSFSCEELNQPFRTKEPIQSFCSKDTIKSCRSIELIPSCCSRISIPSCSNDVSIQPYCSKAPIQSCFTENPGKTTRPVKSPPPKQVGFSQSKDRCALNHRPTSLNTSCNSFPKKRVANMVGNLACSSLSPTSLTTNSQPDNSLVEWPFRSVCVRRSVSLPSLYPRTSPSVAASQDLSLVLSPQEKLLLAHVLTKLSRLSELCRASTDAHTTASVGSIKIYPSSSSPTTDLATPSSSNNPVVWERSKLYLLLVLVLTLCGYLAYIMTASYFYHQQLSS